MVNKAEKAAEKANKKLKSAIDNHESFIFEAGPGAGKTYSLHNSLNYIIEKYGDDIWNNHQKIGCISFTNTAVNEINERVDRNSLIVSDTIHGFCWNFMNGYQKEIRDILFDDKDWRNIIADSEIEINKQKIVYETGNKRKITEKEIYLKHDDIPLIFSKLCKYEKFCTILINKYPFLFIDEYQDSNNLFVNSLINAYENLPNLSVIGLFGDHWQSIYDNTCEKIKDNRLKFINKEANFRSYSNIVDFLNKLRPELIQYPKKQQKGIIKVYHTNSWVGKRETGSHWKGELPENERNKYFEIVKKQFYGNNVDESDSKILILTHKLLSSYQKYENILNSFRFNDVVIKKEDEYISFLIDLEYMIEYYENNQFAELFKLNNNFKISSIKDKELISTELETFKNMRLNKTIDEIIEYLKLCKMITLSPKIHELENKLVKYVENKEDDDKYFEEILKLKKVQYNEIIPLKDFIEKFTPFSTQHNVKGEEYENVLVVFGRGWNKYNFNEMIEKLGTDSEDDMFIRSRNLFYVCVSRAISNLKILFTEKLSETSLNRLKLMVGEENVIDIVKECE